MIEMTTIEGDGYTLDIIARIQFDDEKEVPQSQPEVRALRQVGTLTELIEEAL